MGWLLLAALGIIWAAFLLPTWRMSPNRSVEDFDRNMDRLAETEQNGRGRWIITPRKGMAFVGPRARAQARARERRRRVFVFLLESIGLTALIGLVPPLRVMWYATATMLVLLGLYVWMLVAIRARATHGQATGELARPRPARHRYAADGSSRTPRPAFNGLAALGVEDRGPIVVKPAGQQVGVAGI